MLVLKLTKAGLNAAINAQSVGLKLDLNLIKFGSGKYNVIDDDQRTAMVAPFLTAAIVGGGIETESHTLRFNSAFKDNQARDVYEVGIFTSTNVLFAVASTTDKPFFTTSKTLTTVFASGFRLGAFDSSIVQVILDPQGAIALQLFAQHEASNNPHPQYAKGKDVEDLTENIDKDFVKKSQVTNNLDSSSTENVLSAAMGKKLLDDSIWRVFFGQMTATQSSSSDNTNTYIRMLDRNQKPFGGSTRIYGIGNVVIATSGEQLIVNGKLNNTLTSNATDEALTAQQGKVLNDKIAASIERVEKIEELNIIDIVYPIGAVIEFGTDVNPNNLPKFKGTTWVRFGGGCVTVGQVINGNTSPAFMKTIGSTGGSLTQTLTLDNIPEHKHSKTNIFNKFASWAKEVRNTKYDKKESGGGLTSSYNDNSRLEIEMAVSSLTEEAWVDATEQIVGKGEAFDIIQPSIVVSRWMRTG